MRYRWLDNYHSDSRVTETSPGVYKVLVKDPSDSSREIPVFGVSLSSVEQSIAAHEDKLHKLKDVREKMNKG